MDGMEIVAETVGVRQRNRGQRTEGEAKGVLIYDFELDWPH